MRTDAFSGTAVVTGGAGGIGLALARRLVARRQRVLLTDLDEQRVAEAAEELGPLAAATVQDVRDPATHREVARRAAELGPVTLWVNNAGLLFAGAAWEHSDEDGARLLAVNVGGVVAGCRAAVDAMRAGGGTILNLASLSALTPVPGLALYAASKAAVLSYSTSLAGDLRRARLPVQVRALCPDVAGTGMVEPWKADPGAAMLFAGPKPLSADAVAAAAVRLVGGRQLYTVLPRRRGVIARVGGLLPATALPALGAMQWAGRRRQAAGRTGI